MTDRGGKLIRLTIILFAASLLWACEGDDGADGAAGPTGPIGPEGPPGPAAPPPDPVAAAVEAAQVESCATCHDGVGEDHQAIYDSYVDPSRFTLTINSVTSVDVGGTFDLSVSFSVTKDGLPFDDYLSLPQRRFYATTYDSATGQYLGGLTRIDDSVTLVGPGDYLLTEAGYAFDPTINGQVYGWIADGVLLEHEGGAGAEIPEGSHVHLYDDVANAALAFGDAQDTAATPYESAANVSGCAKCHGTPYLKHGYRDPIVAGLPDFGSCKSCHNDDGSGFNREWQYMVDEPFNWATGAPETADYSYNRTLMNDVHMAHAMEFPYPQSMSNCNTCHETKLDRVLDDSQFTPATCKSCHPVQGIDAWPKTFDAMGNEILDSRNRSVPGPYFQAHRAPPLEYLWFVADVDSFHTPTATCQTCHNDPAAGGFAPRLRDYHTGYDKTIYDATGTRYASTNTVSIDQITRSGDLLTVNFSATNAAIVPELLISFYGWDTKHFLVGSHERDSNVTACTGFRPGCLMEYVPESSSGSPSPLFTEDPASVPGDWMVTLDMSALQLFKTPDLPTLIADGDISKAEISLAPELNLGGTRVVLEAVDETFDLNAGVIVPDYFKDSNAAVDLDKCNVCHDALASSFHDGTGRGGDGIEVCKNCHTTTFPGSHVEMASRSIDNYVHAIHSFQAFDPGDTFASFDPVLAKRYDQHIKHVFPNFTVRNCEACHVTAGAETAPMSGIFYPVTYNVPDQTESMPGVLSRTDTVATWYSIAAGLAVEDAAGRDISAVAETVTGPASRACGGCHRARLIRDDAASDLASLNAHTESFGTFVENDDNDEVVFGVIDKIMSLFE